MLSSSSSAGSPHPPPTWMQPPARQELAMHLAMSLRQSRSWFPWRSLRACACAACERRPSKP